MYRYVCHMCVSCVHMRVMQGNVNQTSVVRHVLMCVPYVCVMCRIDV